MNLLLLCHYGLYQDLSTSFVHAQAKAYVALGHRVRVIVPIAYGKPAPNGKRLFPNLTTQTADGVELYYVRYFSLSGRGEKNWNVNRAVGAVLRHLKEITHCFTPNVVHAHTLGFDSRVGAAISSRLGCRLVVTSHGSDASLPYEKGELAALRKWCDQADRVVAVSSALAEKIRKSGTQTPIEVILNGFRTEHLSPPQEKEPYTFVQVGHLISQKRVDVTIRAFAKIVQSHPDARLTIIGHGSQRETLEQLCQACGVAHKVTFTGQIPNAQVLEHLSRSQFFIMPSVREGFGIVYIEAMACGCITVGTKGEGIADVIRNGENGFLVTPDAPEEIVSIAQDCLEHPSVAARIAMVGQQEARSLTWEVNVEQYIRLFEQIR